MWNCEKELSDKMEWFGEEGVVEGVAQRREENCRPVVLSSEVGAFSLTQ